MVRFIYILLGIVSLGALIPARAGSITINATFDPSLSSAADAAIGASGFRKIVENRARFRGNGVR